ncbi:hypothetical protein [Pantoea phage PA-1]
MSEISKLIAEIKSEGILRAGNKLEQLYSLTEQMETGYAALQQKLGTMAAENAALKQVFVTKEFSTEVTDVFLDTVVLKIDGDEHYCHQWVDNDSDVIRAVLKSLKEENPTPATDSYLNSVRAEGVEILTSRLQTLIDEGVFDAKEVGVAAGAVHEGAQIAASLRSGTHDTADKAG